MKLLIFDFDGTLGDTRANIIATMQATARSLGYPVADGNAIAATIGLTLEDGFRVLYPAISEDEVMGFASEYRRIFEIKRKEMIPGLFPEVKETLARLKGMGMVLTIASSRQENSLKGFLHDMGIEGYVSMVVGADNVFKGKPDPEAVLVTLKATGIPATEAMVVGDMPVDIMMGKGAGTLTCGVAWGNSCEKDLRESGADYIIYRMSELQGLIG